MASHPPAACCTLGYLHDGEPTGETVKIDGRIEAYLAKPKQTEHPESAILYLPDIFGVWQNSKLMADAFASKGYACLVLDTFNGDAVALNMPEGFDIMGWFEKGSDGQNPHGTEQIDPLTARGISYLKELGFKNIGAVGYCIGAKYVIRHYKNGISCGFVAHPSFVQEEELSAISGPLSIAAAELDDLFPAEKRHESEVILSKVKQPFQINLFSGVHHGFAVRGDPKDQTQRFAKEQAFLQAVAWFDNHL